LSNRPPPKQSRCPFPFPVLVLWCLIDSTPFRSIPDTPDLFSFLTSFFEKLGFFAFVFFFPPLFTLTVSGLWLSSFRESVHAGPYQASPPTLDFLNLQSCCSFLQDLFLVPVSSMSFPPFSSGNPFRALSFTTRAVRRTSAAPAACLPPVKVDSFPFPFHLS